MDWVILAILVVVWTLWVVYASVTVTKAVLESRATVRKEVALAERGTLFNVERDRRLAAAQAVAKDREVWATPMEVFEGKPLVPEPKPELPKAPKQCPVCQQENCSFWRASLHPVMDIDTAISLMKVHAQGQKLEEQISTASRTPPPPRPVPDDPIYGRVSPKKGYVNTKPKPGSPMPKVKVTINSSKEKVTIEGRLNDELRRTVRHELDNIA